MNDNLTDAVCLQGTAKIRLALRKIMVPGQPGNVLPTAFLQSLGCTSYALTVAVAQKLINNIAVVMGRLKVCNLMQMASNTK